MRQAFSVRVRDSREFTIKASRKSCPTDRCELDSHADTIVGGANCILLETSGETARVHSFSNERDPFPDVPTSEKAHIRYVPLQCDESQNNGIRPVIPLSGDP